MLEIKWDESWELGLEEIDAQHKNLIYLVNSIINREDSTLEFLKNLIFYVGEHFITEEIIMMRSGYPTNKIIEHKKEHDFLRKSLLEFSFKFILVESERVNPEPLSRLLEEFSVNWFKNHFLQTDKELVDWIKEVKTEK